jgi:hypothetical protein
MPDILYTGNALANVGFLTTSLPTGILTSTGGLKVYAGGSWVTKPVKIYIGGAWVSKPLKRYNGSSWVTMT